LNDFLLIVSTMVSIYGRAINNSLGSIVAAFDCIRIANASAKPKIRVPMNAPMGFQFPRKQIAKAIHPRPPIMFVVNIPRYPIE